MPPHKLSATTGVQARLVLDLHDHLAITALCTDANLGGVDLELAVFCPARVFLDRGRLVAHCLDLVERSRFCQRASGDVVFHDGQAGAHFGAPPRARAPSPPATANPASLAMAERVRGQSNPRSP